MSTTKPLSYKPTDALTYDPNEAKYWQTEPLQTEVHRAFEICHGCRMCFKYCDTFPDLFKLIDDKYDGDVTAVTKSETNKLMDSCFQCKLCEVQCPYTPRDNHEFQLDFPKLVHRYQAQRFKKEGAPLRSKVLGDPDSAAKMARASFGMANVMNKVSLHRWFMEQFLGVHRKKLLPDFAQTTFSQWVKKNKREMDPSQKPEAVLFQTCYVDLNEPQIGKDTLTVLEKNQVKIACISDLECCGMPAWEYGNLEALRAKAAHNIERLLPFVKQGAKVLAINPTCSMMLRREYPELVEASLKADAQLLADATMDPSEFLWSIRNEARFAPAASKPNGVAYHAPCHLRTQSKGFKGRDLIRKLTGDGPSTTMECCGHDGTYAMKKEFFESSIKVGKKAFDGVQEADAEVWVTDCPLAALQFQQHAGKKPMHPMSFLAKSYESEGFINKLEVKSDESTIKPDTKKE